MNDGNLQMATAEVATVGSAHDPSILAALDSMAGRGTFFEPTLDATRQSVAYFNAKRRHIPSEQEDYVRAASGFGIEVTREAVRRGVTDQRGQRSRGLRAGQRARLALRRAAACWWTRSP